jgi:FKBP-type peptidyl-prolyl cis-trans isomerase 2
MAQIKVAFKLISDKQLVDEATKKEPLVFEIGDGTLDACLENCIKQVKQGESQTFLLSPEDAFGFMDEDKFQLIDNNDFAEDLILKVDEMIEFEAPNNSQVLGRIETVNKNDVLVDFNHPLAGHNLTFEVRVL